MRTGRPKTGKELACHRCWVMVYRHPSTLGRRFCSWACRDAAKVAKRVRGDSAKCSKCREWKPHADMMTRGTWCKRCNADWHLARNGVTTRRRPYRAAGTLTDEEKRKTIRDANRRQHQARRAAGPAPGKFDLGRMLCMQDARCIYCGRMLDQYHVEHK